MHNSTAATVATLDVVREYQTSERGQATLLQAAAGPSPPQSEKVKAHRPLRLRGWAKKLSRPTAELIIGLMNNNLDAVRSAIDDGADVDARNVDRYNTSALHLAALQPEPDMVLLLLQHAHKKPLLVANDDGQTAFHACAKVANNTVSLPLLLLVYGALGNDYIDHNGRTYMHELMTNKVLPLELLCSTTEHMLRNGHGSRLLNKQDTFMMTVLDVAAERLTASEESALHLLLLQYGARRGSDVDNTKREHHSQDERRQRQEIGVEEEFLRRRLFDLLKAQHDALESLQRRRRQVDRLAEREALARHEINQDWSGQRSALTTLYVRERLAVMRMANVLLEDKAATALQCAWRQHTARRDVAIRRNAALHLHRAAAVVQRWWRQFSLRRRQQQDQEHDTAARIIQRWYTGGRARRYFVAFSRQRQAAAMRIWVAYRRYRGQQRLTQKEIEKELAIGAWCGDAHAALNREVQRLQSIFRMHQARVRYNIDRRAVVTLQAMWRGKVHTRDQRRERIRGLAVDQIRDALKKRKNMAVMRTHLQLMTTEALKQRVRRTMVLVTKHLWRGVFMDLYKRALQRRHSEWWWRSAALRHSLSHLVQSGSPPSAAGVWPWWAQLKMYLEVFHLLVLVAWCCTFAVWPRGHRSMPVDSSAFTFWWGFDLIALLLQTMLMLPNAGRWFLLQFTMPLLCCAAFISDNFVEARLAPLVLLVKLPFVVRHVAPSHLSTRIFCTCFDLVGQWLLRLAPLSIAVLVGAVRAIQSPSADGLRTSRTHWAAVARVLLQPSSSVIASHIAFVADSNVTDALAARNMTIAIPIQPNLTSAVALAVKSLQDSVDAAGFSVEVLVSGATNLTTMLANGAIINGTMMSDDVITVDGVVQASLPVLPIALLWIALWTHVLLAVVLGVLQGVHKTSSEHMAATAHDVLSVKDRKALRRQHVDVDSAALVDAVGWEDDINSAKAAIEAAHFDHRLGIAHHSGTGRDRGGEHAPVDMHAGSVSYSASTIVEIAATTTPHQPPSAPLAGALPLSSWDLRNEAPELRIHYDAKVIATALSGGKRHEGGGGARADASSIASFLFVQWNGGALQRISHAFIATCVACSIAFPGLYWMELAFSAVLMVEFVLSMRHLGLGFVLLSRGGFSALVRLFSIVVGLVPQARPLTALRGMRLLEGWSSTFPITSAHVWCCSYCLYVAAVLWGVGVVSLSQFREHRGPSFMWMTDDLYNTSRTTQDVLNNTSGFHCTDAGDCVATFTKYFLLPGGDVGGVHAQYHVDPVHTSYVAAAVVVVFRLLVVPLLLGFVLHCALGTLSAPVRFLRLLVRRTHDDVVACWRSVMVECPEWFEHRRMTLHRKVTRGGGSPRPPTLLPPARVVSWPSGAPAQALDRVSPPEGASLPPPSPASHRLTTSIAGRCLDWAARAKHRSGPRTVLLRRAPTGQQQRAPVEEHDKLLLQRSRYATLDEIALIDQREGDPGGHLQQRGQVVSFVLSSRRYIVLHVANSLCTLTSVAFLWVNVDVVPGPPQRIVDGPLGAEYYSNHQGASAVAVAFSLVQLCVHGVSVLLGVFMMPADATSVLTVVGSAGLVISEVHYHVVGPSSPSTVVTWPLRYLNLLRLAQLFWPHNIFADVQRAAHRILTTSVRQTLGPIILLVCAGICVVDGVTAMVTTMGYDRSYLSSVNLAARNAFYNFVTFEHSTKFIAVLHFWFLPAVCILSALTLGTPTVSYNTKADAITQYPLLHDDPLITGSPLYFAASRHVVVAVRWLRNVLLVLYCCAWTVLFSYRSNHVRDDNVYWAVEISCSTTLLFCAAVEAAVAMRRSLTSWRDRCGSTVFSSRHGYAVAHSDTTLRQRAKCDVYSVVVWIVCVAYWCVALAAAVMLFRNPLSDAYISATAYDQYLVPIRVVWVAALLPRSVWRLVLVPNAKYILGVLLAAAAVLCGWVSALVYLRRIDTGGECTPDHTSYHGCVGASWEYLARYLLASEIMVGEASRVLYLTTTTPYVYSDTAIPDALNGSTQWPAVPAVVFVMALMVKIVLAVLSGALMGRAVVALRSCPPDWEDMSELPAQAVRLHKALSGGVEGIVSAARWKRQAWPGAVEGGTFVDMLPNRDVATFTDDAIRFRYHPIMTRLCYGTHGEGGIPRYLLRQLLEECGILHPALERRRLHALLELLTCLPIMRMREKQCAEYVDACVTSQSGGPALIPFDEIAAYRTSRHTNTLSSAPSNTSPRRFPRAPSSRWSVATIAREAQRSRNVSALPRQATQNMISPSRLVEAVAWCEAAFPIGHSIESMKWLDFLVLQQQVRGALALQALWRMHMGIRDWEKCVNRMQRAMAAELRRRLRRHQRCHRAAVFSADSMNSAIQMAGPVYSVSYFHAHLVEQLRGRFVLDQLDARKHHVQLPPAQTMTLPPAQNNGPMQLPRRNTPPQPSHQKPSSRLSMHRSSLGNSNSSPTTHTEAVTPNGGGGVTVHPSLLRRVQGRGSTTSWQNKRYAEAMESASAISRPQSPTAAITAQLTSRTFSPTVDDHPTSASSTKPSSSHSSSSSSSSTSRSLSSSPPSSSDTPTTSLTAETSSPSSWTAERPHPSAASPPKPQPYVHAQYLHGHSAAHFSGSKRSDNSFATTRAPDVFSGSDVSPIHPVSAPPRAPPRPPPPAPPPPRAPSEPMGGPWFVADN